MRWQSSFRCSRRATPWRPADNLPERDLANSSVDLWVQVTADLPVAPMEVFEDFVDDARYSAWLGVPVTLPHGRFTAELEWGTKVRGHYEVVAPPSPIAMRWDFEDDAVPVPGAQTVAYLRLAPSDVGTHVEVHQQAVTEAQAQFLRAAWSGVLGRLCQCHQHAHRSRPTRRAPRRKRTD